MNPGPGGFDISSLTRTPSGPADPGPHHMSHPSAFGHHHHQGHPGPHHLGQMHQQQGLHSMHQQSQSLYPTSPHLLLPNMGLGNHMLNPNGATSAGMLHHPHAQSPLNHTGHGGMNPYSHHQPQGSHVANQFGHHQFNQGVSHQVAPSHHNLASVAAAAHHMTQQHQSHHPLPHSPHPHHHHHQSPSHSASPSPASLQTPSVPVPSHSSHQHHQAVAPPPPAPTPAPPTAPDMTDETNQLAASINLASVQSLVDLLVELPIPDSLVDQPIGVNDVMPSVDQHVQFYSQGELSQLSEILQNPVHQHHMSTSLSLAMAGAKSQMDPWKLNFADKAIFDTIGLSQRTPSSSNDGGSVDPLDSQSYLLSQLKEAGALDGDVRVPPVPSHVMDQVVRMTKQDSTIPVQPSVVPQPPHYWNPWQETSTNQSTSVPATNETSSPTTIPLQAQSSPSPQTMHPTPPHIHQPSPQHHSSQSSMSSPHVQQAHSPYMASPVAGTHANSFAPAPSARASQSSLPPTNHSISSNNNHISGNHSVANHMSQPQSMGSSGSLNENSNTSTYSTEPMTPNHITSPAQPFTGIQMPSQLAYNNPDNGDIKKQDFNFNNQPVIMLDDNSDLMQQALADYYKNQNGPTTVESKPLIPEMKKPIKRPAMEHEETPRYKKEKKEYKPPPPSVKKPKQTYNSPVKASTATSFGEFYISSSYLKETKKSQLKSADSNLPMNEKFEAMLDEVFEMNAAGKATKEDSDEDDDEDDYERRQKKKKGHKMNGDSNAGLAQLFDINLSASTLANFVSLSAKIKRNNQMAGLDQGKIANLLTVLTHQMTVQSAGLKKRRVSTDDPTNGEEDEGNITNSDHMIHKFESCCDCSLIALNIMSSKGMSSRIYLEECIEQIIAFLNTTIQQFTTIGSASTQGSPTKGKSKSPKKQASNYMSVNDKTNRKTLAKIYIKWSEMISLLVELLTLRAGTFTDIMVLATTRLALGAFFLESLTSNAVMSAGQSNEVQLNALNLTTTIFSQYPVHRNPILEELLQSIGKININVRSRTMYKVSEDGSDSGAITMFSALVQKLIQSIFVTPTPSLAEDKKKGSESKDKKSKAKAASLKVQYEIALKTSYSFLSTFLMKCCGLTVGGQAMVSTDTDLREVFNQLVMDLLVTLHKPNWPASQLLTQVLVKILTSNISKKDTVTKGKGQSQVANLNLKIASIDHLGNICCRFAKELSSVQIVKEEVKKSLNHIMIGDEQNVRNEDTDEEEDLDRKKKKKKKKKVKNVMDRLDSDDKMSKEIWKHLIRFCDEQKLSENKDLLVSIWLKEMEREIDAQKKEQTAEEQANGVPELSNREQLDAKILAFMNLYKTAGNPGFEDEEYHVIDFRTSELIIRYLDISQRTTVRLVDSALSFVISSLSGTTNTTMRSRAMKCLGNILNSLKKENAINLLARDDLQKAMKAALLDTSTSVREATIDLLGRLVLSYKSVDLVDKYYDIISDRVLDTGVSVRKRVIKILKDICIEFPDHPKIPDICSKIIKRVNDEGEGIRKLVLETFTSMWFKEERSQEAVKHKVKSLTHSVASCIINNVGTEWLQQLLTNLFAVQNKDKDKNKNDDDDEEMRRTSSQLAETSRASIQIIDLIITEICDAKERNMELLASLTTLWLFGKTAPNLLIHHIPSIQPFLSLKVETRIDGSIFNCITHMVELILPKVAGPSPTMINEMESNLTKHILNGHKSIIPSCVSCLSVVIHKHSKNFKLVTDIFHKYLEIMKQVYTNRSLLYKDDVMNKLNRIFFISGILAKHFEFEEKFQLFDIYIMVIDEYKAKDGNPTTQHLAILISALTGFGTMLERNPVMLNRRETAQIVAEFLDSNVDKNAQYREVTQCQILKHLTNFLSDDFNAEIIKSKSMNWAEESLKSTVSDDGDSTLTSSIIQKYMEHIRKCLLSPIMVVRKQALSVCQLIHSLGHTHPINLIPFLIASSSDDDMNIRTRSDQILQEIDKKYAGFVGTNFKCGFLISFLLHRHFKQRGYRVDSTISSLQINDKKPEAGDDTNIVGRLTTLYGVVSSNRTYRRSLILSIFKYFDADLQVNELLKDNVTKVNIDVREFPALQEFICDNLIWLPYTVWDEPLFILYNIETSMSVLGTNIIQQFKELLHLTEEDEDDLDASELKKEEDEKKRSRELVESDDDDMDRYKVPDSEADKPPMIKEPVGPSSSMHGMSKPLPSIPEVESIITPLVSYYKLYWAKNMLRELFSINDLKMQDYSPNEAQKVFDKTVHRRIINPKILDKLMAYPPVHIDLDKYDENIRTVLLNEYQRFKNIQMTGVDPIGRSVAMILKDPSGKSYSAPTFHMHERINPSQMNIPTPAIPRDVQDELIQRAREEVDCSVNLGDQSIDFENYQVRDNVEMGQPGPSKPPLKLTINRKDIQYPTMKKKKKMDKKKKKKRRSRESDIEDESDASDSDDSDY